MDSYGSNHQVLFDCNSPIVIGLVGPNGSGKSSIVQEMGIRGVKPGDSRFKGRLVVNHETGEILIPVVNPDAIAAVIRRDSPTLTQHECDLIAFDRAEQIRQMYASAGIDFAFETVGSHPSKVMFLEELKRKGYTVAVLFVSTESSDINIRRVAQRVQLGGHDVETEKIVSRYERTMALLPHYFMVADYVAIYDNSVDAVKGSGQGPRLLLTKRDNTVEVTPYGKESPWLAKRMPGVIY